MVVIICFISGIPSPAITAIRAGDTGVRRSQTLPGGTAAIAKLHITGVAQRQDAVVIYRAAGVRDPKVWRDGDRWLMVLGARDLADRGKVLLFSSTVCEKCRRDFASPDTARRYGCHR
jgi:hypothetical protein